MKSLKIKKSIFQLLKTILGCLIFFTTPPQFLLAETAPNWYLHQNVVYPTDRYITAVGEGNNREEAETAAVASISLYFKTTTDVCNNLIKNYNECQNGEAYSSSQSTSIQEKAKITSQTDFFGVQFEKGFVVDGKYTILAYIDRDTSFKVYEQRVSTNSAFLKSCMIAAEDFDDPVSGFNASKKAVPVADLTAELVKMARIVKNVDENYFAEATNLIKRTYTAYETNKKNLVFKIVVTNDYQGMIERTISDLLEDEGYALSNTNGSCEIPVEVTVDRENTTAGIFLYCGVVVNIKTRSGEDMFSYSRNFPKKGAKSESMAYKRAFQEIQKELENSFMQEFNAKLKG